MGILCNCRSDLHVIEGGLDRLGSLGMGLTFFY